MARDELDVLMKMLRAGRTTVVFTKMDGVERTMVCTLNLDMVPSEHHPTNEQVFPPDGNLPTTIRVYDLEKTGWRSFRLDKVKTYVGAPQS